MFQFLKLLYHALLCIERQLNVQDKCKEQKDVHELYQILLTMVNAHFPEKSKQIDEI